MEIVLHNADMAEAEAIRLLTQIEGLPEIGFGRFVLRPNVGKELHAELHQRRIEAADQRSSRAPGAEPNRPERRPAKTMDLVQFLIGRKLANREGKGRRITAIEGLPAMGLDGLGSS